ncbi:YceI family protein [Oceanimonas pelagia]|uniref:YceI family protein n=1 Tax=Oceanimonas pelagia TaxID=3028314 RepID=A0AA50KLR8_9GAMM|nr:YceI family protein [Oceanimonas pelagia]WMC09423.1 YceI family protein [Oceanimonas pelagia]
MLKKVLLTSLCLASTSVLADWQLNNELSRVSFVTVKKESVGEPNHFERITGRLSDAGRFELTIDLASVESGIPIRNERLEEYLFETGRFPKLVLSADLSGQLDALESGEDKVIETDASLNLHGKEKTLPIAVLVSHKGNGDLVVSSWKPVIVQQEDFGFTAGIDKLQELAGLPSITRAVPVSFVLTLNRQ